MKFKIFHNSNNGVKISYNYGYSSTNLFNALLILLVKFFYSSSFLLIIKGYFTI